MNEQKWYNEVFYVSGFYTFEFKSKQHSGRSNILWLKKIKLLGNLPVQFTNQAGRR